jgi:hypothetical protein
MPLCCGPRHRFRSAAASEGFRHHRLFGVATSGVVLATTLHAIDFDYRVIVVDGRRLARACGIRVMMLALGRSAWPHILTDVGIF